MGKATAGRPFVARVLLPEGREVEFSLDHGPLQEQVANLCETHGIDYDEDENLKVLVMECPFGSNTVDVVLGHLSDLEILPRRSPFHLLDGLQLAERQLQDLDDAMSRGGSSSSEGVATAVKVLLQSIHQNEIFAQEVIAQAGIPLLLQALLTPAAELAALAVAELLHYDSGAEYCEENKEEVFSEETLEALVNLSLKGAKSCFALLALLLLIHRGDVLRSLRPQMPQLLAAAAEEENCALMLLKVIQDAVEELKLARKDEDLEISLRLFGDEQARTLQEKLTPQMLQPYLVEEVLSSSLHAACCQLQRDSFAEQNRSLRSKAEGLRSKVLQETQQDLTIRRLEEKIRRCDVAMTKMLEFVEVSDHPQMEQWLQDMLRKGFDAMPLWPKGQTPLHYFAMYMEDERLLELLLSLGCPVERRDGDGLTAAQRATQRGRHDLALLIDGYAEEPQLDSPMPVSSFIQLGNDEKIDAEVEEEATSKEAAERCQGYLHKYPTSGHSFWRKTQKRYFALRCYRKAKAPGRLATPGTFSSGLCWELGYWESEEAFRDPGQEPKNTVEMSEVISISQVSESAEAGIQITYREGGNQRELLAVAKDSKEMPSATDAEAWCQRLQYFSKLLKDSESARTKRRPVTRPGVAATGGTPPVKRPEAAPVVPTVPMPELPASPVTEELSSFLGEPLPAPRRSDLHLRSDGSSTFGSNMASRKSVRKGPRRERAVSRWNDEDDAEEAASSRVQEFRIGSFSSAVGVGEERRSSLEDMYSFALELLPSSWRRSLSRSRSSLPRSSLTEVTSETSDEMPMLSDFLEGSAASASTAVEANARHTEPEEQASEESKTADSSSHRQLRPEPTAVEEDETAKVAKDESAESAPKAGKGPAKGGKSKGPPAPSKGIDSGATATEGDQEAKVAGEESVEAALTTGKGPAKGGKSKGPPAISKGGDSGATATEGDEVAKVAGEESAEAAPKAGKGPAKGGKSKGPPALSKGGDSGATATEGEDAAKLAAEESAEPAPKAGKGPAKGGKSKGPPAPSKGGDSGATAAEGDEAAKVAKDESVEPAPKAGKGPAKGGKSKGPPAPSKGGDSGATEGDEAAKVAKDESAEPAPKAGKGPAKGGKSKGPPAPNKGGASSPPSADAGAKGGKGPAKGPSKGKGKGKGKEEVKLRQPKIKPTQSMKQLWWTRFLLGRHLKEGETIWDVAGEEDVTLQCQVVENRFGRGSAAVKSEEKTTVKKEKETLKAIRIITDPNLIVGKEAAIRNLPASPDVAKALMKLDSLVLTPSHLAVIKKHACPQPAQVAQLEEALRENPGVPLALPEEYMWQISRIPAFQARISCWSFLLNYKETASSCGVMFSEFTKIQRAIRNSQMLQKLLALILAVGNYLNGSTERGQADGFDLETLTKLDSVKDNVVQSRDARHLIFEMFFCGSQDMGQLAKESSASFYDRGEQLLEELGPLMKSVSRAVQRDAEGTLKMMKIVRVGLEEAEESLRELTTQLSEQQEALQMALELTTDPVDPLKVHMVKDLAAATEEIKVLEGNAARCREDYMKLLKYFNHSGMKSSDFILLWDNLLIPEDIMLAIPLSTLKKHIFPRFCSPSVVPGLNDLLLLWGFRSAEQKPVRKSGTRVRRKPRRERVPTPATVDVSAVARARRVGIHWLSVSRRRRAGHLAA